MSVIIIVLVVIFFDSNPGNGELKPLILLIPASWIIHFRTVFSNITLRLALWKGYKLPKRLENFPVHPTSLEDYSNSKNKVDRFIELASKDEKLNLELRLSSAEINNIYLQGKPINKYRRHPEFYIGWVYPYFARYYDSETKYTYLEIQENGIFQKNINYPSFKGRDAIFTTHGLWTIVKREEQIKIRETVLYPNKEGDEDFNDFLDSVLRKIALKLLSI